MILIPIISMVLLSDIGHNSFMHEIGQTPGVMAIVWRHDREFTGYDIEIDAQYYEGENIGELGQRIVRRVQIMGAFFNVKGPLIFYKHIPSTCP